METQPTMGSPAPVSGEKVKLTPKEFFLWFGILISLYASVSAFITMLFTVLDKAMPDAIDGGYYYDSVSGIGALSVPISIIVIMFPIFTVLTTVINRSLKQNPERANLRFRKFAIYLTLFLSAIMIAVDLIVLIQYFLNGGITPRFLLKVLFTLITAGITGWYFLIELKRDVTTKSQTVKIFGIVAWVLVVASFVYAFMVFGSPKNQRALTFDQQRINALSGIQSEALRYWVDHGTMPTSLDNLSYIQKDPEAILGKTLEYHLKQGTTFEVCATFSAASTKEEEDAYLYGNGYTFPIEAGLLPPGSNGYPWKHDAGYTCFTRVIDTVQNPPKKNQPQEPAVTPVKQP